MVVWRPLTYLQSFGKVYAMALDVFMKCGTKQTSEKGRETLRFELELAPPTDVSTNEWSYMQLVDDALKKVKFGAFSNALWSFEHGKRILYHKARALFVLCGGFSVDFAEVSHFFDKENDSLYWFFAFVAGSTTTDGAWPLRRRLRCQDSGYCKEVRRKIRESSDKAVRPSGVTLYACVDNLTFDPSTNLHLQCPRKRKLHESVRREFLHIVISIPARPFQPQCIQLNSKLSSAVVLGYQWHFPWH